MTERLEETLRRLKRERDEADRRYNEALTALDRTLPPLSLNDPPSPVDTHQLEALNNAWNIIPAPPSASGLRQTLARFVWNAVAPYVQRQVAFNSWLVDHLNRNVESARESQRAAEQAAAALRQQFAELQGFQSRLIVYLQQITAYVDTRDREAAGGALVLNTALSGLAENVDKRAESIAARDSRLNARTAEIAAALEEVRALAAVSQQSSLTVKRELERLLSSSSVPSGTAGGSTTTTQAGKPGAAFAPALDAYKYLGFEDQFRGSRDVIRTRLESYLPFFAGASDVLDVGCGRGEFLELLATSGVSARGIDLNHEMAESCRARGLDVVEADAVGYLTSLPDASLGGLFAAQVVEHLQPAYLLQFLELAGHKLRPGARLVLETLNPACWVAFFDSYIRDITHVTPLHPETLRYLVLASGFSRADIEYRSPVPPKDRLAALVTPEGADEALSELAESINANTDKLNRRLFTHLDYAVIGQA
jgi:SAM-dependent methyltransferase